MADESKLKQNKFVKNQLLSNAAFPLDNLSGSSFLVPVSNVTPSILPDEPQEIQNILEENQPCDQLEQDNSQPANTSSALSYSGFFNSFFGSSTQSQNTTPVQPDPQYTSSSPFSHLNKVQSYSPALEVPSDFSDIPLDTEVKNPAVFQPITPPSEPSNFTNIFPTSSDTSSFLSSSTPFPQFDNSSVLSSFLPRSHSESPLSSTSSPALPPSSTFYSRQSPAAPSPSSTSSPAPPPSSTFYSRQSPAAPPTSSTSSPAPPPSSTFYPRQSPIQQTNQPVQVYSPHSPPPPPSSFNNYFQLPTTTNPNQSFGSVPLFSPISTAFLNSQTSLTWTSSAFGAAPDGPVPPANRALQTSTWSSSLAGAVPIGPPPTASEARLPNINRTLQASPAGASTTDPLAPPTSTTFPVNLPPTLSGLSNTGPDLFAGTQTNTWLDTVSGSTLSPSQSTAPPVPLFNPSSIPETPVPLFGAPPVANTPPLTSVPPSLGGNTFRLGNQKKPAYAPLPGLSSHHQSNLIAGPSISEQPLPSSVFEPEIVEPQQPSYFSMATSDGNRSSSPPVVPPSLNNLADVGQPVIVYRPVYHHWFYRQADNKDSWLPFSMNDSLALEQAYNSAALTPKTIVATDGGRYDVHVVDRKKYSIYWEESPKEVRRCSWFFKGKSDSKYIPYDENTSYILEDEYKLAVTNNAWRRKVEFSTGNYILIMGPTNIAHIEGGFPSSDTWDDIDDLSANTNITRRYVKRGVQDEFEIEEGEPIVVDHLLFVVHGIGSVCDLSFRTIEEAVDGFRKMSFQLINTHFQSSIEQGAVNRIEILPISWHQCLHENTGIDEKLKAITLRSIPKLRDFTNDTLLDILFYTSPVYCQTIMQHVGNEMNQLYEKFKSRNPTFTGTVSLAGHSLGSLILFDLLCHQKSNLPSHEPPTPNTTPTEESEHKDMPRRLSKSVSYVMGTAGTGQPYITYPRLNFNPTALFAMGSPIGMFVTVRGIDSLGADFVLPTCPRFFNIFHPYDPVAYRIEALIDAQLGQLRPVLIPHHKGRKRMHLELKDTMARVGADLKQKIVDSVRSTWNQLYQLTVGGTGYNFEQQVDEEIKNQIQARERTESVSEEPEVEYNGVKINQGRRIDYVLQEAPLESFNEYLSGLMSHLCYWSSEDTVLMITKEIYSTMNISPDKNISSLQQQQMYSPSTTAPLLMSVPDSGARPLLGVDPTAPIRDNVRVGPPPIAGFVKK